MNHYPHSFTTKTDPTTWPNVSVCCVWLPVLALRVELVDHPEMDGLPLVMVNRHKLVELCSTEALQAGIHPGLPVREVSALCPSAVILQPDPLRIARIKEQLSDKLRGIAPEVEIQEDCLYLNLQGLQMLYKDSLRNLEQALRAALPVQLDARLGFAAGKFVALIAAQKSSRAAAYIVPNEWSADFLSPQSATFLPLAQSEHERLRSFGITTVGQFAALPFTAVQAQFGKAGATAWHLAHGNDPAPVIGITEVPHVLVSLRLDDPLVSVEGFLIALRMTLARAYADPLINGHAVRKVRMGASLTNGSSWEYQAVFKAALLGKDAVFRAIKDKLLTANTLPTAPFEEVVLELSDLGRESGKQASLFDGNTRRLRQLAEVSRQLHARYGHMPLYNIVEVEPWSRIPERRWALMPFEP